MTTTVPKFTKEQERALLRLWASGGGRYGTQYSTMCSLRDIGLCYAHDKGESMGKGRWVWRLTPRGKIVTGSMFSELRTKGATP